MLQRFQLNMHSLDLHLPFICFFHQIRYLLWHFSILVFMSGEQKVFPVQKIEENNLLIIFPINVILKSWQFIVSSHWPLYFARNKVKVSEWSLFSPWQCMSSHLMFWVVPWQLCLLSWSPNMWLCFEAFTIIYISLCLIFFQTIWDEDTKVINCIRD